MAGGIGAAERVGVAELHGAAGVGEESRNAGVVRLEDVGIEVEAALVVAAEIGDRPAQGLDVDAPTAAGAVVDEHLREAVEEFVPEAVEASDVADFGDALSVGRVQLRQVGGGIEVEVLPVAGETETGSEVRDGFAHVDAPLLVAVVEQRAGEEIGVFFCEVGGRDHTLRLEPEHHSHAGILRGGGHVGEAVGVDAGICRPVARPGPPVTGVGVVALLAVAIPARVDPEVLVGESLRLERLHAADHLLGGETAPQLVGEQSLADTGARGDMREMAADEATELVGRVFAGGVVHHEDAARAQLLAWLQIEAGLCQPRFDADAVGGVGEFGAPGACPANGDHGAKSALRNLEEWHLAV